MVIGLHLLLLFVAGALVGWWRNTTAGSIGGGMLAGLLYYVINLAIFFVFDEILRWTGRAQPDPELTASHPWWEALIMFLIFAVIGIVLGMVGGLISALLAAALRRVRGGGGPAAPPGVS